MKIFNAIVPAFLFTAWLTGCQCWRCTEHYNDAVDHIAYTEPSCESLYHPCFDLTRIGWPDWCCCGFNRAWCRHGCCAEAEARQALPCGFCAEYYPPYSEQQQPEPPTGDTEPPGDDQPAVPPQPAPDNGAPPKPKPPAETTVPVWTLDGSS